ncbi:MAG: glycosyltransferase family A protein [Pontiella sp.]
MKASFVIATYNRAADLERCLDSILKQQDCEFEILVIDDASTDHTCEMVREKYHDRVKLISQETNCGSVRNRNYGANLAKEDILFLIDDDTEFPNVYTVREIIQEFEDPRVGAVAIPYLQDGILKHSSGMPDQNATTFVVASYIGCCSAVRRSSFISLGGYEGFLRHGAEEDDLCIRLHNEGELCIIGRVSEPMVHYESPIRNFQKWDYAGRRSSLLYIWKNCPTLYLLPNLIVTTFHGVQHAFRIHRFRGNFAGLAAGYGDIIQCIIGRGFRRSPVRKEIYDLTLKLRKKPLPRTEVEPLITRGN